MTRTITGEAYERMHPCVVVLWPSPDCLPCIGVATCCERMEGKLRTRCWERFMQRTQKSATPQKPAAGTEGRTGAVSLTDGVPGPVQGHSGGGARSAVIPGLPSGMGSKRAVVRGGKAWVIDDSPGLRPWQAVAIDRMQAARGEQPPADQAVRVRIEVWLPRPQAHYRANGDLKPAAADRPRSGRDLDKVARAVLDCGSAAGWWTDDARVCEIHVYRSYCDRGRPPQTVVAMEVA